MRESKITPVHYEVLIKIFELDGFAVHMFHLQKRERRISEQGELRI
jgi:hypothetical protein